MKKLYYTCIDDDMPKDTFDKISANFDKLTPDSTISIVPVLGTKTGIIPSNNVPVWGAQTGTVNSPTADTVPVIVPIIVPVSGTKTGTV